MQHRFISSSEIAAAAGAAAIVLAMLAGPVLSPPEFDWVRHTTSEQAGQGMDGAWAMQIGFTGYGLGVFAAALLARRFAAPIRLCLGAFGAALIATAVWSNLPIAGAMPADLFEDWLHSLASGAVGTAFALMCFALLVFRQPRWQDKGAWSGLAVALLVPLAMNFWPDIKGVLQRGMFVFSIAVIMLALREAGRS